MIFRTELTPDANSTQLSHHDKIVSIGSCFAENMAVYLQKGKFHVSNNPFGILYNPVSIATALEYLWNDTPIPAEQLIQQGDLWYSFLHHGSFNHSNKETLENNLNADLTEKRAFATNANRLIITLGTSNVFIYQPTHQIVANCHKIPNQLFRKDRLTVENCVVPLANIFEKIKYQSPLIEIILSISPIRHIRDGLVENQRSKATLLLAAEQLCLQFPFVHYFPAYELILDDLRDYRFFKADMIHPNEIAIEYVWEKFTDTFFATHTKQIYKEVVAWQQALNHRPLYPQSKGYELFVEKTKQQQKALVEKYPHLKW
jgi:hypothetical protein